MEDNELQEALDVIESTNLKYFTKDQIAEFMALKGSFIAQLGHSKGQINASVPLCSYTMILVKIGPSGASIYTSFSRRIEI